jgi:hypothetical protein
VQLDATYNKIQSDAGSKTKGPPYVLNFVAFKPSLERWVLVAAAISWSLDQRLWARVFFNFFKLFGLPSTPEPGDRGGNGVVKWFGATVDFSRAQYNGFCAAAHGYC